MKACICKFHRSGVLPVDIFGGTFATGKACFMTVQHHRFVGCKIDSVCFEECVQRLVLMYARQFPNLESNMSEK